MAYTILLRRGTASSWADVNSTLEDGEQGLEQDTGLLKIGDGATAWNDLPYFLPPVAVTPIGSVAGPFTSILMVRPDGTQTIKSVDNTDSWLSTDVTPVVTPPTPTGNGSTVVIDDTLNIGTGNDQVNYTNSNKTSAGAWVSATSGGHTWHHSGTTGDIATIKFTGIACVLKTMKGPNQGQASWSIDGSKPVTFDQYTASQTFDVTVFSQTGLSATAAHTLVITVLGTKNASSSAVTVNFQEADITATAPVLLPPVLGTPTVTAGTLIDQATTGTGTNQMNYVVATSGDWHTAATTGGTGTPTSANEHYCIALNDYLQVAITGVTGCALYGSTESGFGKQDVLVDGATVITGIDAYAAATVRGVRRFFNGGMTSGAHTLKINQRSDKNGASSGLGFSVESLMVGSSIPAGTVYLTATSVDALGNESSRSNEVSAMVADCGTITQPFTVGQNAVTTKIYAGTASKAETLLVATITAPTATATITTLGSTVITPPSVNPTTNFDANGLAVSSLTVTSSTGDTNGVVTGTVKVISNGSVAVADACISVRDSSGVDTGTLDFAHLNAQTITTTPYAPTAQTITLATAGTYTFFFSYNFGGTWYHIGVPTVTLIVAQASIGPNTGGTVGANLMLTVGARSGLPVNIGSQNIGQDSTNPSSITSARTFVETGSGVLEDSIHSTQFINDFVGLDSDFTTLHAMPTDSPIVLGMPPGWGQGATDSSWAHIATGAENSHFFGFGVAYANYCVASRGSRPVIVTLAWEYNGSWYKWSAGNNGDTNASFIAGFRVAAAQIKAGAASVGHANMVVIDLCSSGLDAYWGNPLTALYPGDDVVDELSVDFYDWPNGTAKAVASTPTLFGYGAMCDLIMSFCIAHGKPMAVSEWGLHHTGAAGEGGDNPAFINGFMNWLRTANAALGAGKRNLDNITSVQYFQDDAAGNVNSSVWSQNANNNPNARNAYKASGALHG